MSKQVGSLFENVCLDTVSCWNRKFLLMSYWEGQVQICLTETVVWGVGRRGGDKFEALVREGTWRMTYPFACALGFNMVPTTF